MYFHDLYHSEDLGPIHITHLIYGDIVLCTLKLNFIGRGLRKIIQKHVKQYN